MIIIYSCVPGPLRGPDVLWPLAAVVPVVVEEAELAAVVAPAHELARAPLIPVPAAPVPRTIAVTLALDCQIFKTTMTTSRYTPSSVAMVPVSNTLASKQGWCGVQHLVPPG